MSPMTDRFCADCGAKLRDYDRGKFCYGCKTTENCPGCDAPATLNEKRFLCKKCLANLPGHLRHLLMTTPAHEAHGWRIEALRALAVDPETKYMARPRGPREPREDCGHKSYRFQQATLLSTSDDEVCDECGHVRRAVAT